MFSSINAIWNKFTEIGTAAVSSEREKRDIRLFNRVVLIVIIIQVVCLVSHFFNGLNSAVITTLGFIAGLCSIYFVIKRGRVNVAKMMAIVLISIDTCVNAVVFGEQTHVIDFLLLAALSPLYFFELKNKRLIFAGIAVSLIPFALYQFIAPYVAQYALPVATQLMLYKLITWEKAFCMMVLLYLIYNKNVHHEKEMLQKENELERRNDDLHHFVNATSHDLKSPLRNIASHLQLLERRNGDNLDEYSREMIAYTIKSVKHLNQLIGDIYQYSVADSNDKPLLMADLNDLLALSLKQFEDIIAGRHAVISSNNLPTLKISPSHIETLFANLIGNALKYNTSPKPEVTVNATVTDTAHVISVTDNGIGIAPEYKEQIFEIFKRLHNSAEYEGTGVGLAICSKIADTYGGKIWVESEPGKGSTFFFSLDKELVASGNQDEHNIQPYKKMAIAG